MNVHGVSAELGTNQAGFAPSIIPQLVVAASMGASLTALYMFNGLQESVKAAMRLTDLDLSLVEGVAVAIPLALAGIPVGLMIDRVNRMRVMVAMTLLWVIAALGTAWSPTLPILFSMRLLAATAGAAMLTTSISLAADFSRPEHRGRAMLIANLGKIAFSAAALPVGAILIIHFARLPLPVWLGAREPWRAAHIALALLGLVIAAVLATVREPMRHEVGVGLGGPIRVALGELWVRRAYLGPLVLGQVGILMADAAATIWATPILSRDFGLQPIRFAGWLGLAGLIAGVFGSFIGGYAADAGLRRGRGGIMLGAVIASAIAVPATVFPILPSVAGFIVALTVLLFCGTVASMALLAVIGAYLPNETRGLAFGVFLAVGGLIGFGVAPTLVIGVSSMLGGEAKLAPALAIVGVLVSLMALAGFIVAMRRTPQSGLVRPRLDS